MSKQSDLINNHPPKPSIFDAWLNCTDKPTNDMKCHRELTPKIASDSAELIEWFGRKLFYNHHNDIRIQKLKEHYNRLGFHQYAEQNRKLPRTDDTKKGNAAEILLSEYIENCLQKQLIKLSKLKYSPNVDQAIKGDDTLLVEVLIIGDKTQVRLYLGEAKYRGKPTAKSVTDICGSLSKYKKPLSYSFLIDELSRDEATKDIAELLDSFILDEIKNSGNLVYTGFLWSNPDTGKVVDDNQESDNKKLVFISLGMDNAEDFINKSFEKAEHLVLHPEEL